MTYIPGTIFRAYTADNSKHYSAVLLKDGRVFEIKNPDTRERVTYDSFDSWFAEHPDCTLKVDISKSSGCIIPSDTNGVNYPTEKHTAFRWVQWLYSIVGEFASSLLTSEDFKTAYNHMVEVATKHKQELDHYDYLFVGYRRYTPLTLSSVGGYRAEWSGYPGSFHSSHYYHTPYTGIGHKRYTKEDYTAARVEIVNAYKRLYEIVNPVISEKMAAKRAFLDKKREIATVETNIRKSEKKIKELESSIAWRKSYIAKEKDSLPRLQQELFTAEQKILGI